MKPFLFAIYLILSLQAFSQDQVNTLIRSGKYEDALKAIKAAEGEGSKKFLDLKQWMSHGYRANLKKSDTDVHTSTDGTPSGSEPSSAPQGYRITQVSGFPKSWMVVMNKGAYNTQMETYNGPGAWPKEWITQKWNEGYRISMTAGDSGGWVVVMSKGTGYTEQKYYGPGPFPEKGIGDSALEDFRLTAIAGYKDQWVAVVSKGTSFGRQRFTSPTDFVGKKDWIKARWDEGYRITHLAGDSVSQGENSFVIVMTLNSGINEQTYQGPSAFPKDWIKEKWDSGYSITAATGYQNWIVVMSKGKWSGAQTYQRLEAFPDSFIKSKW